MKWRAGWMLAMLLAPAGLRAQPACPPIVQPLRAEAVDKVQGHVRDRGPLWRLQRDGRTSWLYGTLHLGRAEWAVAGPAVQAALAAAEVLALEVDVSDPATTLEMKQATPASPPLPPALQARLQLQAQRACLPEGLLADIHPVLAVTTLSVIDARWEGLDPQFGQEALLAAAARELGHPVVGLESVALQLALLIPADPAEVADITARTLTQLEQGRLRAVVRRLARAWESGHLADLAAYEAWCDCVHDAKDRALYERLNDQRNPGLAAAIDALHRQGRSVFAAVGALHMTGPQALPLLLRRLGYQVERVLPGR